MEKLGFRRSIAVSLACSLGLAACAIESKPPEPKETTQSHTGNNDDVQIEYRYTPTGKRITGISPTKDGGIEYDFSPVVSWCDGVDLVDSIPHFGRAGATSERSTNHPACSDGQLTPEDFENPSEPK